MRPVHAAFALSVCLLHVAPAGANAQPFESGPLLEPLRHAPQGDPDVAAEGHASHETRRTQLLTSCRHVHNGESRT